MVVLANRNINTTAITLYSAITSTTVFHLLVKCVLLLFIIWVIFKWEPSTINTGLQAQTEPVNLNINTETLYFMYKQKIVVISIICIVVIITVWFLKKYQFYTDDLFFIAIILVLWVYAWRQNNNIAGFIGNTVCTGLQSNCNATDSTTILSVGGINSIAQSQDIIMPNPGVGSLDSQGLKVAPVDFADKRTGILPEHYDYLPDNIKHGPPTPLAFDPMSPINSSDELPQFNKMINLMEPSDHPTYKLSNEVLTALNDKCLEHDSTEYAKPMTEFMRQNGSGQSKWAFVDESDSQPINASDSHAI